MNEMDTFELSIVINRPAEEVFEYLSNLENDRYIGGSLVPQAGVVAPRWLG